MAADNEASCDADPNFAVICGFFEKFGTACGLNAVDFLDLQEMLENTQEVSPALIDLHVKLIRKLRKSIVTEKWERTVVKICHSYSSQDAWEIERFGYKKARLSVKLRLLKELLEMQFDINTSFKNKINLISAKDLRSHPLGRDKLGNAYWYQADDNCQIRVYKEDPDEETWALVAKDRQGLTTLISNLAETTDSSSTEAVTNEDSNSLEENKPLIDTGQQETSNGTDSKKSSAEDEDFGNPNEPVSLTMKSVSDIIAPQQEEKKVVEVSGIKEKYMRNVASQSDRKAVESAGFVDVSSTNDLKRSLDEEIEEPSSIVKRARTDRPTLLGGKKKPYLSEDEFEENDEEYEGEDEMDSEVGEEIAEPLMLVTGKGNGEDNKCPNSNPIIGEEVEENIMYFYGQGNGRDCDAGNDNDKKDLNKKDCEQESKGENSIISPTKNNFKLGTIIDTKTEKKDAIRFPPKKSRWDIGNPLKEDTLSTSTSTKESQGEAKSKETTEAPVLKKSSFFFGPGSGFSFKAPAPIIQSVNKSFGASVTSQPTSTTTTVETVENNVKEAPETKVEANDEKIPKTKSLDLNKTNENTNTEPLRKTTTDKTEPEDVVDKSPSCAVVIEAQPILSAEKNAKESDASRLNTDGLKDLSSKNNSERVLNKEIVEEVPIEKTPELKGKSLEEPTMIEEKLTASVEVTHLVDKSPGERPDNSQKSLKSISKTNPLFVKQDIVKKSITEKASSTEVLSNLNQSITPKEKTEVKETVISTEEPPKKETIKESPTKIKLITIEENKQKHSSKDFLQEPSSITISKENISEAKVLPEKPEAQLEPTTEKPPKEKKTKESPTKIKLITIEESNKQKDSSKDFLPETSCTITKENIEVKVFPEKPQAQLELRAEEKSIFPGEPASTIKVDDHSEKGLEVKECKKSTDIAKEETSPMIEELPIEVKSPESRLIKTNISESKGLVEPVPSPTNEKSKDDALPVITEDIEDVPIERENEEIKSKTVMPKQSPLSPCISDQDRCKDFTGDQSVAKEIRETNRVVVEIENNPKVEKELTQVAEESDKKTASTVTPQAANDEIAVVKLDVLKEKPVEPSNETLNERNEKETPEKSNLSNKDLQSINKDRKLESPIVVYRSPEGSTESEDNEAIIRPIVIEKERDTISEGMEIEDSPLSITKKTCTIQSLESPVVAEVPKPECGPLPITPITCNIVHRENREETVLPIKESIDSLKVSTKCGIVPKIQPAETSLPKTDIIQDVSRIAKEQLPKNEETVESIEPKITQNKVKVLDSMPIVKTKESQDEKLKTDLKDKKSDKEGLVKIPKLDKLDVKRLEEQIVSNQEASLEGENSPSPPVLEPEMDISKTTTKDDEEFAETPCKERKMAMLTEEDAENNDMSDDMNNDDDGNLSEPMELEESKPSTEIVQTVENKTEKPSLLSLSLDYTGETPTLSEVQEMVKRVTRKRTGSKEAPEEESAGNKKRRTQRRSVDVELRRSIEEQKQKEVSSSEEEHKKRENDKGEAKEEKKKKKKKRRSNLMGLDIPDAKALEDATVTGVRQSRRIAQIKIKEEAERRKLEETALEEMKNAQKKKSKKDEDKDYKAEKRKRNKIVTEDETTNDAEIQEEKKKKKKKRRKQKTFDESNPWKSSTDSSSSSNVEEEEEEEEEDYPVVPKSDHEFSPESDLEDVTDPQPLKRARTVRKEDAIEEEEEEIDDTACQKCHKSDHPEWILLCDGCDAGWHCSCLRPALLVIPEGDWYCPPCQHNALVQKLQEKSEEYDKILTKKEVENRRKERLAYVGISLANVLPSKEHEESRVKKDKIEFSDDSDDNTNDNKKRRSDSDAESGSESSSSSSSGSSVTSSDSDEPIYQLRQRRQAHSYRFNDYDDLINSAIKDEVEAVQKQEPEIRGKDMATIVKAEEAEKGEGATNETAPADSEVAQPPAEESDEDEIKPVKKFLGKKKHRKLNSLDISSEDEDSDESFKGTTSSGDDDEDFDEEYDEGSYSSSSSTYGRKKKGKGAVRRSTRARISRYDKEFINDDSEDSEEAKKRRKRSRSWEETEESEESDTSWGRRKKRNAKPRKAPAAVVATTKKKKIKKKKSQDDSDGEVFKRKKPKIKVNPFDDDDEDEGGRRKTRGKKINYIDALGSDSEDDARRRNQVKDEESEDEFVLNEEEDEFHGEEPRDSDDSTNAGGTVLVESVKKGSKKGKGKGGIKRIKRAQGRQEEALFPPLPDAELAPPGESEGNPIEVINKNLEAMSEKEMEMMMEQEEYATKQLQIMHAQLEKEKRRKELEAKKPPPELPPEMPAMNIPPPSHIPPPVIPTLPTHALPTMLPSPVMMPAMEPQQLPIPVDLQQQQPQMALPVDLQQQQPPPPMALPVDLQPPPPGQLLVLEDKVPKKRGRKPKGQSPEYQATGAFPVTPTTPKDKVLESSPDAPYGYNQDGTPKKRRGRGKGKKTLEKEAAAAVAAAVASGQTPPTPIIPPAVPPTVGENVLEKAAEQIPPPSTIADPKATPSADASPPVVAGKLGVAAAPQPFSQSQPKPSVITRMLQSQPGQPPFTVGHSFPPDASQPPVQVSPFIPGQGVPPRPPINPNIFRPGANHYPVIRSGAPPVRGQNIPLHLYHPMEGSPTSSATGPGGPGPERSSPALTSPSSASPISNKSDRTPPPLPPYVRAPLLRFPVAGMGPGLPRHPQLQPHLQQGRPPYHPGMPHNFHYVPYGEGSQFHSVPPYGEQFHPDHPDGPKNYEDDNGEFGGLVSYFSSQREDDLDT